MSASFDDFLGLLDRPLDDRRALFFTGVSGSGKSTYVEELIRGHPAFRGLPVTRLGPAPIDWSDVRPAAELVVVDEIQRVAELAPVCRLLSRGHRLLVASHVPERYLGPMGLVWPIARFETDGGGAKLGRWLHARGVRYTEQRLRDFVSRYGSSYTDLRIVLERGPEGDFDRAYERFERTSRLVRRRVRRHPVMSGQRRSADSAVRATGPM